MPAHKQGEVFQSVRRSALNFVGNGPGQSLGTYMINRMLTTRIKLRIQSPRKKERNELFVDWCRLLSPKSVVTIDI